MKNLVSCILAYRMFFFLCIFLVPTNSCAQLKVGDIIEKVLVSNPDLQAIKKRIDQAQGIRVQAGSPFNLSYSLNVDKSSIQTPFSFYSPTVSRKIESWDYFLGVSKKLPWGMQVSPSIGVSNYGYLESFPQKGDVIVNHGLANLKIVQPLLLGFGKKYNYANIQSSQLNISVTEHQYVYQASSLLLQILKTYIEYIGAYQNLLIQTQTAASLTKSINDVNRLIQLDALPASEVVLLQAQLFNQKAMHKLAENKLESIKNRLGASMGLSDAEIVNLALPDTLFPVNISNITKDAGFIQIWLEQSILNRHDYLAMEKNIETAELAVFVSKKNIKPRLDLSITSGYDGTSEAKGAGQYFQPMANNIPGINYTLGLSFIFAGKNDLARGQQMEALSALEILEDQKKALVLSIKNQIKQSGNSCQYNAQVASYLIESVKNYNQAYQNEIRKFQAGTSTSFTVVQVQNNYLSSKNQLVSLMVDLNIAILEFRHQTGTLVEAKENNVINIDLTQIFSLPVAK